MKSATTIEFEKAEASLDRRLRRLATFAIEQLGMEYGEFVRRGREVYWLAKRIAKVKRSSDELEEIKWQARLKAKEHQAELARQRRIRQQERVKKAPRGDSNLSEH